MEIEVEFSDTVCMEYESIKNGRQEQENMNWISVTLLVQKKKIPLMLNYYV